MNNYTYSINEMVGELNGSLYRMIGVKVRITDNKFPVRAPVESMSVTDGTKTISAFSVSLSGNQKEMTGSFATDAFNVFTGEVTIQFGYGNQVYGVIEHADPASIAPFGSGLTGITFPDADNNLIQSLTDPA
jgi:hypothetical protein